MRLLIDENLSEVLLDRLLPAFAGSSHVRLLLGEGPADNRVWEAAKAGGFTIITLDSDFEALSVLRGAPPKVIWLGIHNPSNRLLTKLLSERSESMLRFAADPESAFLAIAG